MAPKIIPYWAVVLLLLCTYSSYASVQISATRTCLGQTTHFYNQSAIPATQAVEWDLNNDGFFDDAVGDSATKTFAVADTFEVRLKITDSSGVEYFSQAHPVIVEPVPAIFLTVQDTCQGQITLFKNSSTIADGTMLTYEWDLDNDGSTDAVTTNASRLYASGANTIDLKAVSIQGCSTSKARLFTIRAKPTANFSFDPACAGSATLLANESLPGSGTPSRTIWNFGDGNFEFQKDTIYHTYQAGDTFDIKLKVTNSNGCTDSMVKSAIIPPSVVYSYTFTNGQSIEEGTSTEVTLSGNYTSLTWNDISSDENPRVLTDSAYYSFTVANAICSVTDSFYIQTYRPNDITLKAANDFLTPNGDGKNDQLEFKNLNYYTNCQLEVYDVRGNEVYKTGDYKNDWEGTGSGKQLNAGVYYYVLKCDGQDKIKGLTNIIK